MKKLLVCLAFLVASVAPAFATYPNAEYCFGSVACQYLADNAFSSSSSTAWSYSSGSGWSSQTDACGTGSTGVAALAPGDSVWQYHATDSGLIHWKVEFDLYKTSTSVSSNDHFTVFVNNGIGTTESHIVYAGDYSGLCGSVSIPLSANFGGYSNVRVMIRRYSLSTVPMYIDNVSLFGTSY
jgi:hypothetical protein